MSRSKRQHWVPRFYLRHFATPESQGTDNPRVWIFSKHSNDPGEALVSTRRICAQKYLYSPPSKSGERQWNVDDKITDLEEFLARYWYTLAREFIDFGNNDFRRMLALFVAIQLLRNPSRLETGKEIHRQLVAFYEEQPRRSDGTPDVDEVELNGRVHSVDTSGWHAYRSWGRNDHHRFFAGFIETGAVRTATRLMQKRWSVLFADSDAFITSDSPVGIHHRSAQTFGIDTPGAFITFPISPRRLLVIDDMFDEPQNQYYPLKPEDLGGFNSLSWRTAKRFMITGRPIPDVLNEIVASWDEYMSRECDV